ncbi:MAG: FAD-dependent oxidoreductase [Candidatus Krumholzibacteria bacterium]|nr:FAD-dependent oxidoreductase [Candidatus Krumholzibacteria bacterium]
MAAGAWTGKPMMVEGEKDTPGVVTGADFLPARADDREPVSGTVVVVGGGNTAMDVARTSWRLGADKVIILYRRTRDEMPADRMEIEDCLDEGIEIMELAAPIGIIAEKGRLKALRCQRMKLGEPDASGRRRPVPLEGSEFDLPCNLAVSAIGQAPVLDGLTEIGGAKLKLTRWDTISIDTATCATNLDGVFAGGDAADDGPTVVIDAIRDGQRAAAAIDAWLRGAETQRKPFTVKKEFWTKPGKAELGEIGESPRHEVHLIDVDERKSSFREVSTGFDFEDNTHECARCLSCGCVRFDDCALRLYAQEYGVDMEHFKGYVRKHRIDDRHPYIIYDPNKCVLCARCIRTCARVLPISAIGLVGRGFRTEMRPAMNDPLVETNCVSCGNCVDSCPTAALTVKYPFPGRSCIETGDVVTNCAFCSLACSIKVRKFGEDRYYIASSGAPGKYLCRYGRFGNELFIKQDRIKAAEIRGGGARAGASLEDACGAVVSGLRSAAEKYGAGKVGVFISPECTNEEMYLAARIAREGLGTNNVASLSILCAGRESGALDESFGFTASTADRSCMADADLFICNNTAMESDHLVLAAEMLQSVRKGAGLIVTNSTLDPADQLLSTIAMDPMRGRAAVLWNGIIRVLMNEGCFDEKLIRSMEGSGEFLSGMDISLEEAEELSGIGRDRMEKAASIIRNAERIVIIHGPDRPQDQASGDMKVFANLVALLRAAGKRADLLLPRLMANSAGLEVTGADPAFTPGRIPAGDSFKGARSHKELRGLLEAGEIKAALIIGEDPMAWGRTGSWFGNVEFMAAMDWTDTETTRFANVVLPGSTFLETNGTRCNFEGRVARYVRAVEPPAGFCSVEILRTLANGFGIKANGDVASGLDSVVAKGLGKLVCHYWNKGEAREGGRGKLVAPGGGIKAGAIDPPLTHSGKYRKEIREVGTDRFRVRQ